MSQENEAAVFIDDDQRRRLLRACFDTYYADIHPEQLVFDTNGQWLGLECKRAVARAYTQRLTDRSAVDAASDLLGKFVCKA